MARQPTRKLKFKLTSIHIEYLSRFQSEWYTAKATRSTAQFVRKRRRRIASMMEETSGEGADAAMKSSIEDAVGAWFKANCRPRAKAAKIGTKARSGRDVFAHQEWKEVAKKKRELMEADQFEGDRHIGFHQRAVTELWDQLPEEEKAKFRMEAVEWDNVAPPPEIQLINAEAVNRRTWLFAEDIYRQANARMWAMIAFRDKDGVLVKQVVDHNDRLDGGTRLDEEFKTEYEKMQFERLFDRWMHAFYSGEESRGPAQPPKKPRDLARVELEKNKYGEPILPDITQCPANEDSHRRWLTKVFRAFIFDSYSVASGGVKTNISWTRLFSNLRRFVDDSFWPDRLAVDLKDPSVMRYDVMKGILGHWYQRQLAGADPVFSFSHYEDPKNDGIWLERVARIVMETDSPRVSPPQREKREPGKSQGMKKTSTPVPGGSRPPVPIAGPSKPPVAPTPDWMESPLKRMGTTIVEVAVSPPRKKKKSRKRDSKEDERGNGKGKGKEKARVNDDSSGQSEGDEESSGESIGDERERGRGKGKAKGRKGYSAKDKRGKGKAKGCDDESSGQSDSDEESEKDLEGEKDREKVRRAEVTPDTTSATEDQSCGEGPSNTHAKSKKAKGKGRAAISDDERGNASDTSRTPKGRVKAAVTTRSRLKANEDSSAADEPPETQVKSTKKGKQKAAGNEGEGQSNSRKYNRKGKGKAAVSQVDTDVATSRDNSNSKPPTHVSKEPPPSTDDSREPDEESSDREEGRPAPKRNMPTLSVGLTTRAMAKSSAIQTRSKAKSKGVKPKPVGVKNQGDIFDLKDRRRRRKND
ncbi:hypothetical protein CC1G_05591 [Coprinopsis cinerea okayama7|uniref:Uncharacterized protein n=1 Tax=Coprinopsis cinerea (strain Okayama-7 / 130 / ATCC MYA-4618 / FGSC 9003) TaxID=240176 RepID=A8P1J3_COPC7|nr:hypothetical protein CC1G_05591 [Coprinopsis cinerea okayama7\|eukprot:XP_001838110.1 hypothetical protein CC1G_05591 [Coprinopsis cinerea okayama7\